MDPQHKHMLGIGLCAGISAPPACWTQTRGTTSDTAPTTAWPDGQELQLQTPKTLGLTLSTQRSPHLNVLLVLPTAPTPPDFCLIL